MPTSEFLLISCQWFTSLLAARASQLPALCGWLLSRPCNVLALRMQQRNRIKPKSLQYAQARARDFCVLNRGLYEMTRLETRLMVGQRTLTSPRLSRQVRARARANNRNNVTTYATKKVLSEKIKSYSAIVQLFPKLGVVGSIPIARSSSLRILKIHKNKGPCVVYCHLAYRQNKFSVAIPFNLLSVSVPDLIRWLHLLSARVFQ
jgi:hypothetical protein